VQLNLTIELFLARSSEQGRGFLEAGCAGEGVSRPWLRNGLEAAEIEFEWYEEMEEGRFGDSRSYRS
jgi:hypothetical protein